jgi:hypothetical protein
VRSGIAMSPADDATRADVFQPKYLSQFAPLFSNGFGLYVHSTNLPTAGCRVLRPAAPDYPTLSLRFRLRLRS